jgi:ABC-type Na+ transport system ATPase subunit NatA
MIADRVLIIHKGKKVAEESMDSLTEKASQLKLQALPEKRYVLEAYFLSLTSQ